MNRYSVYETGTDRPIAIYRTAEECAAALGITPGSFYKKIGRARAGRPPRKYEIFTDEDEEVTDGKE